MLSTDKEGEKEREREEKEEEEKREKEEKSTEELKGRRSAHRAGGEGQPDLEIFAS